jgi:hypothetical protein
LTYETINVPRNSDLTVFANLTPGCTLLEWDSSGGARDKITSGNSFILDGIQGETTILAIAVNLNET